MLTAMEQFPGIMRENEERNRKLEALVDELTDGNLSINRINKKLQQRILDQSGEIEELRKERLGLWLAFIAVSVLLLGGLLPR